MIDEQIAIDLPAPWSGAKFETKIVGPINYLVGPNGSGKSRFAGELLRQLKSRPNGARLLGTDRLREMADPGTLAHHWGDYLQTGYPKASFNYMREAGLEGSGIDTILLLHERMELRIRVEATLSHLFGRDVLLEWDSGYLVPKAVRRGGQESYRLDRDECHGIKELLVLLTHLYDDHHRYLIIDEPELNLHPQYQAFFMQEARKAVGRPGDSPHMKVIFLITHSPFILDLRSEDDIKSVISFDLDHSVPKQVANLTHDVSSSLIATGRLNAHHKQLFFSDNPVFVEGHHDALLVEALMEARGVSAAAAGSCIIDCGGAGEVNHYLDLCQGLGKDAHFIYDLDSMFKGQLRSCIGGDDAIQGFLASAGVGPDFAKYVGELDARLTAAIDILIQTSLDGHLAPLSLFLNSLGTDRRNWEREKLASARVAVMTTISLYREEVVSILPQNTVEDIEGRWRKILSILAKKNIHVLFGGTIERYLPCFAGDLLQPKPDAKRHAVFAELKKLQGICESDEHIRKTTLTDRYGELYEVVRKLPSKEQVDLDAVLRRYLSDYVHELQKVVAANPDYAREQIDAQLHDHPMVKNNLVSLQDVQRNGNDRFVATIDISEILGGSRRSVEVSSDTTIANMPTLRKAKN